MEGHFDDGTFLTWIILAMDRFSQVILKTTESGNSPPVYMIHGDPGVHNDLGMVSTDHTIISNALDITCFQLGM